MTGKEKKQKKQKKIHRIANGISIVLMVSSMILFFLSNLFPQQIQADTVNMGMWVCLLGTMFLYCLEPSESNDDSIGDDSKESNQNENERRKKKL